MSPRYPVMQSAKLALLRCENLDLFAATVTASAAPTHTETITAEAQGGEPGLLFRIGPDDQLDLFRHSPAEIAANETRRALKDLDVARVRRHLASLRKASAYTHFVADCDQCIELILRQDPRWADAALAVPWIESVLWPAATRCLQRDAMLLLCPALLALVERSAQRPFDAQRPHAHPSYLWQLLGESAQAVAALERDPHWRDQPQALVWHAQLSEQAQFHERVIADVFELCLSWPDAAETWLSSSQSWATRWSAWCELDDALPPHAFPAWCRLIRATDFPLPTASDLRPGAQVLRIAHQLAGNGVDLALRKALHALCPGLLAAFLATRAARTG